MIRSIGEVTNMKFSPLYTQIIIHGSFSRLGMYCAIRGRITSKMPAIIKIMPTKVKGWKYFKSSVLSLIVC
jgi:hypothetical protein